MGYYKVLVQSAAFHGHEALTYGSEVELPVGCLVLVPLQRKSVLGTVTAKTEKPGFTTKPVLRAYLELPSLPPQLLTLAEWLYGYYPAPLGVVAQQIMPAVLTDKHLESTPVAAGAFRPPDLPPLTEEQTAALKQIDKADTYILHGETGSGKTRVYLECARRAINGQKSVLLLTPEIGLTSQLQQTFQATFGDHVVVLHSQLTAVQRQKAWLQILRSESPQVVIGPRSALFAPIVRLGLIIVDEFHEPAYKQEQAPHYQAVRVASQLAALHKATLILGSATPPIVEYFLAEHKHKPIIRMLGSARSTVGHELKTHVVDLKNRTEFSRSVYLSTTLLQAIEASLLRGEQSLLYLNRRGSARLVLCDNCGWQAVCPRCDLPLTYHNDAYELRCHTCGITERTPTSCPACGHAEILFTSIGTKALVSEVQKLFPQARVQRFDTDNRKEERLEQNFTALQAGEVDILVGTQMLAKGLDLPKLSTLGVVMADTSLSIPDFTAGERTYQLLTQVFGRIGRGHRSGTAVVQTYQPNSPILQAALAKDWSGFYERELSERKNFIFPPYCYLLQLTCRRASSKAAQKAAEALLEVLARKRLGVQLLGPAPAFHEKLAGKYQWQIIVKSTDRTRLLTVIHDLPPSGWSFDIDPAGLL